MLDKPRGIAPIFESRFREQPIRIYGTPEAPLIVAKDVCAVLGIANPRDALSKLEPDEKGVATTDTPGGIQELNVVTESGLYALIFKSRKAEAREFRKWVTSEVLPAIRQTGRYDMRELSRLELIELARSAEIERLRLVEQAEKDRPKLEFVAKLAAAKGSQSIGHFAKSMQTGRTRMFRWLRSNGYIMPGQTVPYQRWVDCGLFEVSEGIKNDHAWAVCYITPKGIARIGEEFAGKEVVA